MGVKGRHHGRFRMGRGKYRRVPPFTDAEGFACVELEGKGGERVVKRVHELVAQAFVPNPDNLPEVRHRNGDLADNRACNLEWCRPEDNTDRRRA